MSTWLIVLLVLAGLIALALLLAAVRPKAFRIARSALIAAPAERIYPLIANFHAWRAWSPFEGMDAELKRDYGGAADGVGATYAWEGRKSGAGRMEITDATPPGRVAIRLNFLRPFKAENQAIFTLEPAEGATRVTWAMTGENGFLMRLMGLVMSPDRLVGGMFAEGLAKMKAAAEAGG